MSTGVRSVRKAFAPWLALTFLATCGPSGGGAPPPNNGDGGASMDPNADHDGDGYTPNQGDCDDNDPTIHPGATELCDGKDHNCNHIVDDTCDDDKDGYNVIAGGKNMLPGGDCDDQDPLVNPGAIEIVGDHVDNNCNGMTDEVTPACDGNLKKGDPVSLAASAELCAPWVQVAKVNADSDPRAYDFRATYGSGYTPKAGKSFLMLSTGLAVDKSDPSWIEPQPGTAFANSDKNPDPMNVNNNICGIAQTDPTEVNDYVELTLTLKVPTNAKSFSFSFMFVSSEYPEFVGTEYNDKFLAILDSKAFQGNVSFDSKKNPITVNAGFFDVCDVNSMICSGGRASQCTQPITQLNGTGFEDTVNGQRVGGGTGWLTTTAPVTPGETATLRFIIFDEGDHEYDSSVIIDNFQWQAEPSMAPMTIG